MNKSAYDEIKKALAHPPNTPFRGEGGKSKHFLFEIMLTQASLPEQGANYANLRVAAFLLVDSGLTYQELGAPIPLNYTTVLEHIQLKTWQNEFRGRMQKNKSARRAL